MIEQLITKETHFNRDVNVYKNAYSDVYELLKGSTSKYPDREAVIWKDRRLTYRDLLDQSNQMAANLQHRFGFKKGDRLAILSQNRIEFCLSIFAVAALGGIIVPLNTRLHPSELKFMLKDSGTSVLVVEDELLSTSEQAIKMAGIDLTVFVAGQFDSEARNELYYPFDSLQKDSAPLKPEKVEKEDPVFIMYTSGTTGTPKGAIGTHLGVTQNVVNFSSTLNTDYQDRTLISVPLFHVTGFLADFLHMMSVGGAAVLMHTFKTKYFLELLDREKITYLVTVPTIYVFLLNHPDRLNYNLENWRLALYGGAPMAAHTIKELLKEYPHMNLINTYGATECTGSCTFSRAKTAVEKADSVGIITDINEWKIVDDAGNILPLNEIGELCIKGPTVIPEYWNNPEATEREFDEGYWKTGDLGYVDEEGYLYILDRKKSMINRGGENIYSVEIENVLYNHPSVFDAAAVGIPDDVFGEEVLTAIVLKENHQLTPLDVQNFVRSHLADYKVPKYVHFLEDLPRNPSGKVLKHALKEAFVKQVVNTNKK